MEEEILRLEHSNTAWFFTFGDKSSTGYFSKEKAIEDLTTGGEIELKDDWAPI